MMQKVRNFVLFIQIMYFHFSCIFLDFAGTKQLWFKSCFRILQISIHKAILSCLVSK